MPNSVTVENSTWLHGTRAVAAALGIGKNVALRMLQRGELPGARMAGRYRVPAALVPQYAAALALAQVSARSREQALADAAVPHAPGEGGVVRGSGGPGPATPRHKKKRGKVHPACPGCCNCLNRKGKVK